LSVGRRASDHLAFNEKLTAAERVQLIFRILEEGGIFANLPFRLKNPIHYASMAMAFPYRRILSPIAFDENSIKAIAVAADFALSNDGVILLVHVAPLNRLHGGIPSTAETQREELAASDTKLIEIAHRYTRGARNELSLRLGDPAEEIIKAAIDFDADVIVMATHGRKGISHLLIGSVTEGVLRNAVCPVLAIRPAASLKP